MIRWALLAASLVLAPPSAALAQEPGAGPKPPEHHHEPRKGQEAGQMTHVHPPSRGKSQMLHLHGEHPMTGALGPYALTRENSGTAWQPESSIHEGLHFGGGEWM